MCLFLICIFSSVQLSCSVMSDSCDCMDCSTPGLPAHHQLLEFTQTRVHWVGDAIQPSHPLSSPSHPAFNLSQHYGLFQWVSSSNQVAKVLEFQLQHQSFQWILGLISFRMDWLDLLAVQGTLKSLLQHHSSKASILRHLAFFVVQLPHPYMTTGKTIALTRWTFTGKVMSLLFNMLSKLVIIFLPRSKHLLISWLQSPSAVILEPKKIKYICLAFVSLKFENIHRFMVLIAFAQGHLKFEFLVKLEVIFFWSILQSSAMMNHHFQKLVLAPWGKLLLCMVCHYSVHGITFLEIV